MAASKSIVPKFGAWESGDNAGYTVRFETVRKGSTGGPLMNPNDIYANQVSSSPSPPPQQTKPKQKQPEFGAWNEEEEVSYTQYFEVQGKGNNPRGPITNPNGIYGNQVSSSPPPQQTKPKQKQPEFGAWNQEEEVSYTQYFEEQGKGKATPSEPKMNYNVAPTQPVKAAPSGERKADPGQGSTNTRANDYNRPNNGGQIANSVEPQGVKFIEPKKSPLHPGAAGRGLGTTPTGPRQRTQPTAGPSPGRAGGASIPAFGDWNNNPAQADGYTVVFNKLQEDRRNGNVPSVEHTPLRPGYSPGRPAKKQPGCLSWLFG